MSHKFLETINEKAEKEISEASLHGSQKCICELEKPNQFQKLDEPIFPHDRKTSSIISNPEISYKLQENETRKVIESIMNIFERTSRNLEFAATIPFLIDDPRLLQILNQQEMQVVRNTFAPFRKTEKHSRSLEDDDKSCNISEVDDGIFEALKILKSYSAIRKISQSQLGNLSIQLMLFLRQFKSFFKHIVSRMCTEPREAMDEELKYRKFLSISKQARDEIEKLKKMLEKQKELHKESMRKWIIESKRDMILIEKINKKCLEAIKNTVLKYEYKQYMVYKSSELKQSDLSVIVASTKENFMNMKETNEKMENSLRIKRQKLENNLLGLIKKFDTEIGERQEALDELLQVFENNNKEKEVLEKLYYHLRQLQYSGEYQATIDNSVNFF